MHTYIGGWRDNQLAEETLGECVSKDDSTGILKKYSTDVYYWQCELEIIIEGSSGKILEYRIGGEASVEKFSK